MIVALKRDIGARVVARKGDNVILWSADSQRYSVFKGNTFMVHGYKFSDVECWVK